MKKLIFLLGFALTLFSCDKINDKQADPELIQVEPELVGEWGLTEVLTDPGDGSGTFQSVQSDKIIEFHKDGTLTSNGTICDMSIETSNSTSGTYSLTDSTISSNECSNLTNIYFEQNGSTLILIYPCFEACRAKYEKK